MTPGERLRAGRAVEQRMADMGCTPTELARKAGIDVKTLRGLIAGRTWPSVRTRQAISDALGWPSGEILRRAQFTATPVVPGGTDLDRYTTGELLEELLRRFRDFELARLEGKIREA